MLSSPVFHGNNYRYYSFGFPFALAVLVAGAGATSASFGAGDSVCVAFLGATARLLGVAATPLSEIDFWVVGGVLVLFAAGCSCAFTKNGAANKARVKICFMI